MIWYLMEEDFLDEQWYLEIGEILMRIFVVLELLWLIVLLLTIKQYVVLVGVKKDTISWGDTGYK
jgi:formate-dependent nitrite reductase membrane component NrfD